MRCWLAIVLALALGVHAGCGRKQESTVSDLPLVRVQTLVVEAQKVPETHEVVGTVRPRVSATVAGKLTATILSISPKPGDSVKAGEPLAQLDDREARATFESEQAEFERAKNLLTQEAINRSEFDVIEARYRVAKANLSYTVIIAPFDGIVSEKRCDVGDLATPGKPLFIVEQPTEFRLEAHLPERFASAVQVGTKMRVSIEALGGGSEGVVAEVIPVSDPATRSFLVKVDLPSSKTLKSGMFGRAQLVVGERTGLFVPKTAVRERGQLTFVFIVNEGRAQMRLVKTGKITGDRIELLSGVQGGEQVIVSSNGEVTDGRRVQG